MNEHTKTLIARMARAPLDRHLPGRLREALWSLSRRSEDEPPPHPLPSELIAQHAAESLRQSQGYGVKEDELSRIAMVLSGVVSDEELEEIADALASDRTLDEVRKSKKSPYKPVSEDETCLQVEKTSLDSLTTEKNLLSEGIDPDLGRELAQLFGE